MKLLLPLLKGFNEAEAFTILNVLKKAGIRVDAVGIPGTTITGESGLRVGTDLRQDIIDIDEYQAIILVSLDPKEYEKSSKLAEWVKKMNAQGKIIAAVGLAPLYLQRIGILEGRRATVAEGYEKELEYPRGDAVVVDGNIITAKSIKHVLDFCIRLVDLLFGREKAVEVRKLLDKF